MSGAGPSVKHYFHITFLYIKTIRTVIREDFFFTQSAEAAMRQVCREEQEVISVQAELLIRFRTMHLGLSRITTTIIRQSGDTILAAATPTTDGTSSEQCHL